MGRLKGFNRKIVITILLLISVMIFFAFFGNKGLLQVTLVFRDENVDRVPSEPEFDRGER